MLVRRTHSARGSLLLEIYPGLVLGTVLGFAGVLSGLVPDHWRAARFPGRRCLLYFFILFPLSVLLYPLSFFSPFYYMIYSITLDLNLLEVISGYPSKSNINPKTPGVFFPHGGVARRCHSPCYVASSRLALRKNPSVLFVTLFTTQTTALHRFGTSHHESGQRYPGRFEIGTAAASRSAMKNERFRRPGRCGVSPRWLVAASADWGRKDDDRADRERRRDRHRMAQRPRSRYHPLGLCTQRLSCQYWPRRMRSQWPARHTCCGRARPNIPAPTHNPGAAPGPLHSAPPADQS